MATTTTKVILPSLKDVKVVHFDDKSNVYAPYFDWQQPVVANDTVNRVSDPDWRTKVATLQNATNPYSRKGSNFVSPRISGSMKWISVSEPTRPWLTIARFYGQSAPIVYPESDSVLADMALKKLKRKLNGRVGDFQASVPAAELRELKTTVEQVMSMSMELFKGLIRIKRTKGASAFKAASHAWLAFGFGVSPLVNDTKEILKSIQKYMERKDQILKLSAQAGRDWVSTRTVYPYDSTATQCRYGLTYVEEHSLSYRYTCGFDLNIRSANDYTLVDHLHFEIGALAPIFWELTPWSWVLDYFGTVGAFLDDEFSSDPSKFLWGCLNRRYTYKALVIPSLSGFSPKQIYTRDEYQEGSIEYFSFDRSTLTTLPSLALRWKTPAEMRKFGLNKLTNLAAVLLQRKL